MTNLSIAHRRLHNQCIARQASEGPEAMVRRLGAVQAQDYAAARWALGLRVPGTADEDIEQAFNCGAILRTHVMRPTWHFVSPRDIRWLLALTAPRVHAANTSAYRQLELDDATCQRCQDVLTQTLQGGQQLTRPELVSALEQAGIAVDDARRSTYIIMHAELEGIICSGPRRGKQFTYALLAERAPQARTLAHDEALATLTLRYFTSHGPATLRDFSWWSGLTLSETRVGVEMVKGELLREIIDGQEYWCAPSTLPSQQACQDTYLLPNFDEYTVGYSDRSAMFDESHADKFDRRGNVLNNVIVINGRVVGTWRRVIEKGIVVIIPNIFVRLGTADRDALSMAASRYGRFLGKEVAISESEE